MYRGFWYICLSRQEGLEGRGLGSGPVPRICRLSTHSCFGFAFLSLDFWLHPCPIHVCSAPLPGPRPCHHKDRFSWLPLGSPTGHSLTLFAGRSANVHRQTYSSGLKVHPQISPWVYLQIIQCWHYTYAEVLKVREKNNLFLSAEKCTGGGLWVILMAIRRT